ncbi:WhiB family transcriptional regulator [Streptomyces sp. NBC_01384]|uniref:WhiB family transcriptional regulator n=1 Tax=Streptomyces sp. NBC_01384 TaxID=2903847 RepID=UPI00386FB84E
MHHLTCTDTLTIKTYSCRVCSECQVREKCADFALSTRQEFGVWGGLTESDRESRRIR